jgi:hypothetical protein
MQPGETTGLAFVSLVFLAAVVIVLMLRRLTLEVKLLLLGLFTAVLAVWFGILVESMTLQGGIAIPHAALTVGTAPPAGLMRIAVILVLGGLAVGLRARCRAAPAATPNRENPSS